MNLKTESTVECNFRILIVLYKEILKMN